MRKILLFSLLLFILSVTNSFASTDILLNEFSALSDPDWVEIYNTSSETINIDGWVIRDSTQTNKINLSGYICPNSFRKFDFSNRLNNDGDTIKILDSESSTTPINEITYFSSTIPEHQSGQSTSRQSPGSDNWQVLTNPSPQNDESCFPQPTPEPTSEPTPTPSPTPTSPSGAPTPTPSPKATPKSSPTATKSAPPRASPQVLGEQERSLIASGAGLMDTSTQPQDIFQSAPSKKVAGILIVSGAALVLFALGFHFWYRKINKGKLLETKDPFQL